MFGKCSGYAADAAYVVIYNGWRCRRGAGALVGTLQANVGAVAKKVQGLIFFIAPLDTLKRVVKRMLIPADRQLVLYKLKEKALGAAISVIAYQVNRYLITLGFNASPESHVVIRYGIAAGVAGLSVFAYKAVYDEVYCPRNYLDRHYLQFSPTLQRRQARNLELLRYAGAPLISAIPMTLLSPTMTLGAYGVAKAMNKAPMIDRDKIGCFIVSHFTDPLTATLCTTLFGSLNLVSDSYPHPHEFMATTQLTIERNGQQNAPWYDLRPDFASEIEPAFAQLIDRRDRENKAAVISNYVLNYPHLLPDVGLIVLQYCGGTHFRIVDQGPQDHHLDR